MPGLFDTFTIKSVTLRNRIGVSPMCQYVSNDGTATDWHLVHLGARAVGGAGLVIAEATAVEPRGRISPQDAGLWSDKHIEPLARITRFVKEQGAVPGIQLAHAGRKASAARPWEGDNSLKEEEGGWETLAPSAVAFGDKLWKVPKAMTHQDIKDVQQSFVTATEMAVTVGYQWLELHAAHGYLCHSFYSPISNKRTDEYGGSFENRIRFTVETLESMRAVWPENLPLAVRVSCADWVDGGWTIEETIELAKKLKQTGADLIDCSSGFGSPDHRKYPFGPGWQVPFSEAVRREAQVATAAVGMITDPIQANDIIESGNADIVLLAREMLRDPYWPQHAAKALSHDLKSIVPSPYLRWI
jgi:2,4-dienoyl-CoA reductase-like NADH-dependent reductase (Old Yellow Enzyme family)